jgi:hypothetical protein
MSTKNRLLLILTILTAIFLINIISSTENQNKGQYVSCVKNCTEEKRESNKICLKGHWDDKKNCNNEFRSCLQDSRDGLKNKKYNISQYNDAKKSCSSVYLNCSKVSDKARLECLNRGKNKSIDCEKACKNIETTCLQTNQPVCGNDNKTYLNECELKKATTKKECNGACPCKKICKNTYTPVCGRDNNTYPNECEMKNAGIEKKCDGKCPCQSSGTCSKNEDCKENEYCKLKDCSNETGKCTKIPSICPISIVQQPICGCDGNTYSSECEMNHFKISKKSSGVCEPETCDKLRMDIVDELKKAQECNNDSDCIISNFALPCTVSFCTATYNKNFDITNLSSFSSEYIRSCQSFCPAYPCIDPLRMNTRCNRGKCQTFYMSKI